MKPLPRISIPLFSLAKHVSKPLPYIRSSVHCFSRTYCALPVDLQLNTRFRVTPPLTRAFHTTDKMASVPKTMGGILIEQTGSSDVLQWKTDIPVPELKPGQILVKNEWVGVNYIDT